MTWQHVAGAGIFLAVLAIVAAGAIVAVSEVLRTRGGRH